jgi:hypothetical protein
MKHGTPSVARPALEKFMLSLPKYAGFACASTRLSMKVEADEAKNCLSQTELMRQSLRSNVRRVFFGAAGARKQHLHASVTDTAFFVSRSLFCLLFLAKKSRK